MSAEVIKPGLQSSLQDSGRRARALGLPGCGAADQTAYRLANALVGNPAGAAALEITLAGPTLHFETDALVSLCGAPFEATLDGEALALWRAVQVKAGQRLSIGGTARGMRAILAIRGGFQGWEVYGSLSTDLRSEYGGLDGHALKAGEVLRWNELPPLPARRIFIAPDLWTPLGPLHILRVLPTFDATPAQLKVLTSTFFTVSQQADRMGVRLSEQIPAQHDPARISTPNVPGMIQLPPDGRPILLLPDGGTHGGYPTPVIVAQVDLPRLGQLRPADRIKFQVVTPQQAYAALQHQEKDIQSAVKGLELS